MAVENNRAALAHPKVLLEIWEREWEEAGWYTAITLLERMRILSGPSRGV